MSEDRPRLSVSARYRLEIISRGPRLYALQDYQIKALARRGLVKLSADEGKLLRWTITKAGLAALDGGTESQKSAMRVQEDNS